MGRRISRAWYRRGGAEAASGPPWLGLGCESYRLLRENTQKAGFKSRRDRKLGFAYTELRFG